MNEHWKVKHNIRPLWDKTTEDDLLVYKDNLDKRLELIEIPQEILKCANNNCNSHDSAIESFHNDIVNACLIAGSSSLPQSDTGELLCNKPVPGWKEHVKEHRQRGYSGIQSGNSVVHQGRELSQILESQVELNTIMPSDLPENNLK